MRASLEDRMRGASAGKTMYVVPYLMAAPGSPLDASPDDIETMLTIDTQRWRQEIAHREQHLAQFSGLPNRSGKPAGASRQRSRPTRGDASRVDVDTTAGFRHSELMRVLFRVRP